jgi:PTH1 family peptidyl-tRNA hydrolase
MKLIVGLGNPGRAYADTRHNIGFRCINRFAKLHGLPLKQRQCRSQIGTGTIADTEIILAKPKTFMNLSGEAVSRLMQRFQIPLHDLVVIHDDLDIPLGNIRIRQEGSSGGHKGVESIIDCLETQSFPRIRVGIGHAEEDSEDAVAYVLSDFSPTESAVVEKTITRVAEAILCLLVEGITSAMNRYNIPSA